MAPSIVKQKRYDAGAKGDTEASGEATDYPSV